MALCELEVSGKSNFEHFCLCADAIAPGVAGPSAKH